MKALIKKLLLLTTFLLLFLTIYVVIIFNVIGPQYTDSYTASLIDKYKYIKEIDSPKIVLLGDSNVAFGFKSELIEEEFDMPVINAGLQTGLGNAFLENIARINVHEGDIYVLCHTNYADDGKIIDPSLAMVTLENHAELWQLLTPTQAMQLPAAFPYYSRNVLSLFITGQGNSTANGIYSRASFNEYGDISYPRTESYCTTTVQTVPEINSTCVNRINELNEYLIRHGATLYVAAYPISYDKTSPSASEFTKFQESLDEQLNCPIISDFTDYFLDTTYFWDSALHLTDEGAVLRTEQLILDLHKTDIASDT